MKNFLTTLLCSVFVCLSVSGAEWVLNAEKDTYGRSNKRNRNNGGSPQLLILPTSSSRAIISFDLSGITNEIVSAEFQFRQDNTMKKSEVLDLVVAPMVYTKSNAAWNEGTKGVGTRGMPATVGDSTYMWCSFRDVPWEAAEGKGVAGFAESSLWEAPVATLKKQVWSAGAWVSVPLTSVGELEKVRESELPFYTLGLWGVGGNNGFYFISSKQSGHAPKLVLQLKEKK